MSGCGYGLYQAGQPGSRASDDEPRSVFAPLAAPAPVQGEPLVSPISVVSQPAPPPMKRPRRCFHGGGVVGLRVGQQQAEARRLEREPHPECAIPCSSSSSYSLPAAPAPVSGRAEAEKQEGGAALRVRVSSLPVFSVLFYRQAWRFGS